MLLFHMMGLNIKARLQYGRTFIYESISHIFGFYLLGFLTMWIILNKFSNIGGWSFFEMLFLQTFSFFIRGITASILWDAMMQMSNYIRDGRIDKFLVAPVNSLYYIISANFGVWTLSHIAVGAVGMVVAISFLNIHWTFIDISYLIIGTIAGTLVYGALIIIGGALSFWTVRAQWFLWLLLDALQLINYPIEIYPKVMRTVLVFVFPIALINYFPVAHILGKSDISIWAMLAILCASIFLILAAYKFWWYGTKSYQGTGS